MVAIPRTPAGTVRLALADGRYDIQVRAVIGLGIKVVRTDEELARALAARPPAWFDSRDDGAARYLRVSGLAGLLRRRPRGRRRAARAG